MEIEKPEGVGILTCDICNEEPAVGVAASGIGPFSIAWGRICLDRGAEPLFAIEALLDMNGGIEGCAEWFRKQVTFKDGKYLTVEELPTVV